MGFFEISSQKYGFDGYSATGPYKSIRALENDSDVVLFRNLKNDNQTYYFGGINQENLDILPSEMSSSSQQVTLKSKINTNFQDTVLVDKDQTFNPPADADLKIVALKSKNN